MKILLNLLYHFELSEKQCRFILRYLFYYYYLLGLITPIFLGLDEQPKSKMIIATICTPVVSSGDFDI